MSSNNEYMRKYFKANPMVNALNCHNLERRKRGYENITMKEFMKYKKFCGTDSHGRTKTKGRLSLIDAWEIKRKK